MLKGIILKDVDRSIITDETVSAENGYKVKKKKKSKKPKDE